METQAKLLKILVTILGIPLMLVLVQGLLAPLLLVVSDDPGFSVYILNFAVIGGWVGLVGLARTAYSLGAQKSPGPRFVLVTFCGGFVGLALAVYATWFSGFIAGWALVLLIVAAYTVYLWSKFRRC